MKVKIAKRSAYDYDQSLSSQGSCHDTIITNFQNSSYTQSSSRCQSIMIMNHCYTPPKNKQYDQSYSDKKYIPKHHMEWDEFQKEKCQNHKNWVYESQDSKIRKKQDDLNQQQVNKRYKQHVKVLHFEDQTTYFDCQKQNQSIKINVEQSPQESQVEQWLILRAKQKRKVGKILYFEQSNVKKNNLKLPQIIQQESQRKYKS